MARSRITGVGSKNMAAIAKSWRRDVRRFAQIDPTMRAKSSELAGSRGASPSPHDIEANNKCTHEFPNAALGDEVECIGLETNTGDRWVLSRFPIFRTMRKPFDGTIVRVFESERQLLLEFARRRSGRGRTRRRRG